MKKKIILALFIMNLFISKNAKCLIVSAYLYRITIDNKTGDKTTGILNCTSNIRNQTLKKIFNLEKNKSIDIQISVATGTPNTNDWICNLEWKKDSKTFQTSKHKNVSRFAIRENGTCDLDFIEWLVEKDKKENSKKYATGLILPVDTLLKQDSIAEKQLNLKTRSIEDLKKLKTGLEKIKTDLDFELKLMWIKNRKEKLKKFQEFEAYLEKIETELKNRKN